MAPNEEEFLELIFREIQKGAGEWFTFRKISWRLFGSAEGDFLVEAVCQLRPDLFVFHRDVRLKLKKPEQYNPNFDPHASQVEEGSLESVNTRAFWVYVSDWDVGPAGSGPYRAVVHRESCTHVQNRKHREEGVGFKNFWASFPSQQAAEFFARNLHPWDRCAVCLKVL